MAIRDRGMVKWQAAFQLPELAKTQKDFWRDTKREGSQSLTSIKQKSSTYALFTQWNIILTLYSNTDHTACKLTRKYPSYRRSLSL
ncbi:hypothetical protein [Neobacillus bataviensis]|uniref:hypothetical protein n=1 Tax=Neobacillus bataviensis TaxID=220685 RepID=UPI001CBE6EF6|nr:hypothetical protein [Neobacillus bataviensis]